LLLFGCGIEWWSGKGRAQREQDLPDCCWIAVSSSEFRIGEMAAAAVNVDGAAKSPPAPSPFRMSKLTTVRRDFNSL